MSGERQGLVRRFPKSVKTTCIHHTYWWFFKKCMVDNVRSIRSRSSCHLEDSAACHLRSPVSPIRWHHKTASWDFVVVSDRCPAFRCWIAAEQVLYFRPVPLQAFPPPRGGPDVARPRVIMFRCCCGLRPLGLLWPPPLTLRLASIARCFAVNFFSISWRRTSVFCFYKRNRKWAKRAGSNEDPNFLKR